MSATQRKPGRPPDHDLQNRRRDEILGAASRLFAQRGYPDTDVDSVAAELGVAKGTVYRYFPSKRELFLAAVDRGVARLHEFVHARAEALTDPLEAIAAAIETFLEYFEAHPELVELFIQERAHFADRPKPAFFAAYDQDHEMRKAFLAEQVAAGRMRPVGGGDFDVINDLMFGTVLANHFTGRQVPAKEQARQIVDVIYHGILTDEERRRRKEDEP